MKYFSTVDEALDFAVDKEANAGAFYRRLAARVDVPGMSRVFEEFAQEEDKHKAKLLEVKHGGEFRPTPGRIQDLKIAEYIEDVDENPHMSYQDALILAMKREKASFRLYTALAQAADQERIRDAFLALAQEEAKHKLRIEMEYDDNILQEN